MTVQCMETIYVDGKKRYMTSEPLEDYLENMGNLPRLTPDSTACWRGYYGRWKITKDKLYLTGLKAYLTVDGKIEQIGLEYFFPGQKQVFAKWVSGDVYILMGKEIEYDHMMGYVSDKDLCFKIEKGIVINRTEINNSDM